MTRILLLLIVVGAIGGGAMLGATTTGKFYADMLLSHLERPAHDPVAHRPSQPRIEQVKALASLVTLDVPISDVHVSELEGRTGGVRIIVNIQGDVQIMTDLEHARFEDIDDHEQEAVLLLPRPQPQRPRVDHERTRILDISRKGLWRIAPGDGGEQALTNRAMIAAQRVLHEAAQDEQLINRACGRTEQVMGEFFDALGWTVRIRWMEDDADLPAPPSATALAE